MKKKLISIFLSLVLMFTMISSMENVVSAANTIYPGNPYTVNGVTTWDCITFGHYGQSDDPIKWRVLNVNGKDAFIIADQNLEVMPYNATQESVTWETCTLRNWLNSQFIDMAFSKSEQDAIFTTAVDNNDANASWYGGEDGENTKDKIFLLSVNEISNASYGFKTFDETDRSRVSTNTAYVASQSGMNATDEPDCWWLRTVGCTNTCATSVNVDGEIDLIGIDVTESDYAVRPAMHINLASDFWEDAGTVDTYGVTKSHQSITAASSYTKAYGSSAFSLNAKAKTALSYKSSKTSVATVSSAGKVTIKGVGKATITITAASTDTYQSASKQVTIKVIPKATKISSLSKGKKSFKVKWSKVSSQCTGYQIQYSTSSKFTGAKTATVSSYKTTSKTIKSLKAKKKYYVKVRTYKTVSGTKYYSGWSGVKSVKTK